MLRLIPLLTAAVAFVTSGCSEPLSVKECERLLDHYTERLVRDERPRSTVRQVQEKQALARQLAKENPVFEFSSCSDKVSRSQFSCAMAAVNVNGVEQCLMF